LFDAVRGSTLKLESNQTDAELVGEQGKIDSFDSDGFTVSTGATDNSQVNISGSTYVAWNWKADNTSGSSNIDGTITSTVSANPTAGFSIVSYTANGVNGATVGHGLSSVPDMIIVKGRDIINKRWAVYHESIGNTGGVYLESTQATLTSSDLWNNTSPTSSVFSIGIGGNLNTSGGDYIAYCFHSVEGYSKFGSYTGNGGADGPFGYTGFRPAFVMLKYTSGSSGHWILYDAARDEYNLAYKRLGANISDSENQNDTNLGVSTTLGIDMLSNGFKVRTTGINHNISGGTYIYMAFAESPFKYSNAR
jgi:hypothetical protein